MRSTAKIDEIIFQLQSLVNRSDRLKSKLTEDLGTATSMLRYHLSQAANFKKRALQLSAAGGSGGRKLVDLDGIKEAVGHLSRAYSNF